MRLVHLLLFLVLLAALQRPAQAFTLRNPPPQPPSPHTAAARGVGADEVRERGQGRVVDGQAQQLPSGAGSGGGRVGAGGGRDSDVQFPPPPPPASPIPYLVPDTGIRAGERKTSRGAALPPILLGQQQPAARQEETVRQGVAAPPPPPRQPPHSNLQPGTEKTGAQPLPSPTHPRHQSSSPGAGGGQTEPRRQGEHSGVYSVLGDSDNSDHVPKSQPQAKASVTLTTLLVEVAAAEKEEREKKEFQGVDLSSRPQALLQEVSHSDLSHHQGSSMVVGVLLGVVVLCGLVLAALFQCCCRKKRSASQDEQDGVKAAQGSLPHTRTPSPQDLPPSQPQQQLLGVPDEEDRESASHPLLDDDLGDFSAVQRETEILKSFRKPPPPKNRGKASRAARQKQEPAPPKDDFFPSLPEPQVSEGGKEFKDSSLAAVDVSSKRASMELLLADALTKDRSREASRERGREASRERSRELSGERGREEGEEDRLLQEPPPPARRATPTRETITPTRGERTPPGREGTPKLEEPASTERPSSFVEGFQNGGNIFMQIDPTVKRSLEKSKNGSKIPVTAKRSATSPTESPVASPLVKPDRRTPDRRSPQPQQPPLAATESPPLLQPPAPSPSLRPGTHRKFLVPSVHGEQMGELLKSLKTRLQEDPAVDSSSISDQNKSQQEDTNEDLDPVSRERSYSDSAKHKRSVKQTDL